MSTVIRHKRGTGSISSTDKLKSGEIGIKGSQIAFGPVPASGDTDSDVGVIRILTEDDYETPLEGLGIFRSSASTGTATTSISKSTVTVPLGRTLKVGDLILANTTYSYLYRVTAVAASTVTVSYITSLRGNDGSAYTLPTASSTTLGGIKTGYTSSSSNYKLSVSNGNGYVTVPWVGAILTQSLQFMNYSQITRSYLMIQIQSASGGTNSTKILINWGWVPAGNKTANVTFGKPYTSEGCVYVFTCPIVSADTQLHRCSPTTRQPTYFACPYNTGQEYFYCAIGYL